MNILYIFILSDDIKCRETINYQKDENNTSYNLIKKKP